MATSEECSIPDGSNKESTIPDSIDKESFIPDVSHKESSIPDGSHKESSIPDESNKESSIPDGSNKESSIPDGSNKESTIPDSIDKESFIPDGSHKESSIPDGSNKESTIPDMPDKESSTPNISDKESSIPDRMDKESSILDVTDKESSTPTGIDKESSTPTGIYKEYSIPTGIDKETSIPDITDKESSLNDGNDMESLSDNYSVGQIEKVKTICKYKKPSKAMQNKKSKIANQTKVTGNTINKRVNPKRSERIKYNVSSKETTVASTTSSDETILTTPPSTAALNSEADSSVCSGSLEGSRPVVPLKRSKRTANMFNNRYTADYCLDSDTDDEFKEIPASSVEYLDLPKFLIIKPSKRYMAHKLVEGVFAKKHIKKGTSFGPYIGVQVWEKNATMNPDYFWEVISTNNKTILFYIDATHPGTGMWMRYIRMAHNNKDANLHPVQREIEIHYEVTKSIKPGEELTLFYSPTITVDHQDTTMTANKLKESVPSTNMLQIEILPSPQPSPPQPSPPQPSPPQPSPPKKKKVKPLPPAKKKPATDKLSKAKLKEEKIKNAKKLKLVKETKGKYAKLNAIKANGVKSAVKTYTVKEKGVKSNGIQEKGVKNNNIIDVGVKTTPTKKVSPLCLKRKPVLPTNEILSDVKFTKLSRTLPPPFPMKSKPNPGNIRLSVYNGLTSTFIRQPRQLAKKHNSMTQQICIEKSQLPGSQADRYINISSNNDSIVKMKKAPYSRNTNISVASASSSPPKPSVTISHPEPLVYEDETANFDNLGYYFFTTTIFNRFYDRAGKLRVGKYCCDICGLVLEHMYSLKRHFLRSHVDKRYLNKENRGISKISLFADFGPKENKMPFKVFYCSYCDISSMSSRNSLRRHTLVFHCSAKLTRDRICTPDETLILLNAVRYVQRPLTGAGMHQDKLRLVCSSNAVEVPPDVIDLTMDDDDRDDDNDDNGGVVAPPVKVKRYNPRPKYSKFDNHNPTGLLTKPKPKYVIKPKPLRKAKVIDQRPFDAAASSTSNLRHNIMGSQYDLDNASRYCRSFNDTPPQTPEKKLVLANQNVQQHESLNTSEFNLPRSFDFARASTANFMRQSYVINSEPEISDESDSESVLVRYPQLVPYLDVPVGGDHGDGNACTQVNGSIIFKQKIFHEQFSDVAFRITPKGDIQEYNILAGKVDETYIDNYRNDIMNGKSDLKLNANDKSNDVEELDSKTNDADNKRLGEHENVSDINYVFRNDGNDHSYVETSKANGYPDYEMDKNIRCYDITSVKTYNEGISDTTTTNLTNQNMRLKDGELPEEVEIDDTREVIDKRIKTEIIDYDMEISEVIDFKIDSSEKFNKVIQKDDDFIDSDISLIEFSKSSKDIFKNIFELNNDSIKDKDNSVESTQEKNEFNVLMKELKTKTTTKYNAENTDNDSTDISDWEINLLKMRYEQIESSATCNGRSDETDEDNLTATTTTTTTTRIDNDSSTNNTTSITTTITTKAAGEAASIDDDDESLMTMTGDHCPSPFTPETSINTARSQDDATTSTTTSTTSMTSTPVTIPGSACYMTPCNSNRVSPNKITPFKGWKNGLIKGINSKEDTSLSDNSERITTPNDYDVKNTNKTIGFHEALGLTPNVYICMNCEKSFSTEFEMYDHHDAVHTDIKHHHMKICENRVPSWQTPRDSIGTTGYESTSKPDYSLSRPTYNCTGCKNSYSDSPSLHLHIVNECALRRVEVNIKVKEIDIDPRVIGKPYEMKTVKGRKKNSKVAALDPRDPEVSLIASRRRYFDLDDDSFSNKVIVKPKPINNNNDSKKKKRGAFGSFYDPSQHMRRRERITCIDLHNCGGCQIRFETLHLLEKHVKICEHKDKLQKLRSMVADNGGDYNSSDGNEYIAFDPSKPHMCIYCNIRDYKYESSLRNHVSTCRARKQFLIEQGASILDKEWEQRIGCEYITDEDSLASTSTTGTSSSTGV